MLGMYKNARIIYPADSKKSYQRFLFLECLICRKLSNLADYILCKFSRLYNSTILID